MQTVQMFSRGQVQCTWKLQEMRISTINQPSRLGATWSYQLPKTSSPGLRRNGASQFKGHVAKLLFLFEFAKRWGFNTKITYQQKGRESVKAAIFQRNHNPNHRT